MHTTVYTPRRATQTRLSTFMVHAAGTLTLSRETARQAAGRSYLLFPTSAASLTSGLFPVPGAPFLGAPSLHLANSYHCSGLGFPSILLNPGALPCHMAPVIDKFWDEGFCLCLVKWRVWL